MKTFSPEFIEDCDNILKHISSQGMIALTIVGADSTEKIFGIGMSTGITIMQYIAEKFSPEAAIDYANYMEEMGAAMDDLTNK